MATTDCTLGTRFAKSKFLANYYTLQMTESFSPSCSSVFTSPTLDETLAELMETLRLQVINLQRTKLPSRKRVRLLRDYCEVKHCVKEMRLMFVSALVESAIDETEIDETESP